MKKLWFLTLILLYSLSSFAQGGWQTSNNIYGLKNNRGAFTKTLLFPARNGAPSGVGALDAYSLGLGALTVDSTNAKLYFFNPKDSTWHEAAGGSSSGLTAVYPGLWLSSVNDSTLKADSAVMAAYFVRRTDSTTYGGYYPWSNPLGFVPSTRTISTGWGLSGGGDLTTNRTFIADSATLSTYYLRIGDSTIYYPYRTNPLGYLTSASLSGYLSSTLADGKIWIGNASNVATAVTPSGDVTISNAGVNTLATVNSNIGTFNNVTVNAKGLVTAASNASYLIANQTISFSPTGDVTGSTTGTTTLAPALVIGNNKVTDAMIRQSAGLSVIGRSANTTGNVADITAGTDHYVLRRNGTTVGFGILTAEAMNPTYSNTYVLQTDGSGVLSWVAAGSGMTNPMTTTGDIIYSSSGSTPARRGIGSTGQVLQVVGGVPTWSTIASYINLIAGGSKSAVSADAGNGSNGTSGGTATPGYNLFVVDSSGNAIVGGINNIAFGRNTLKSIDAEDYNVAIGAFALENVTNQTSSAGNTGNVAIGAEALRASLGSATASTFGSLAIGRGAIKSNTSGQGNIGIGTRSLGIGTGGDLNTVIGHASLESNTGSNNVAVGYNIMPLKTLGNSNVFMGDAIGAAVTTGDIANNIFIGNTIGAGSSSTTGDRNTAIGSSLLGSAWTSATNNILINTVAGDALTSGSRNIMLWVQGAPGITTGGRNVMIGDQPGVGGSLTAAGNAQININNTFMREANGKIYFNTTSGDISSPVTMNASAQFTIAGSTTGGFLQPTLTTTQQNAISSPASGLQLYNTDYRSNAVYNGVSWAPIQANHYIAKTANYTILVTDYVINCTANSFTVTLPTAVGITGKVFIVKNSGSATTITIATTSSQTVDGTTPATITTATPVRYMSDGANWITI